MNKKNLGVLLVTALLGLGVYNNVVADNEYEEMSSGEALEMLRFKSALEGETNYWHSPLAEKYDGKKVQVCGAVTGKKIVGDGMVCLEMDYFRSEHRQTNWKRIEDFKVTVVLNKNAVAKAGADVGEYIIARGIANIIYNWNDRPIDKNSQESLGILANYQGNGRGKHVYVFEIKDAEICKKING